MLKRLFDIVMSLIGIVVLLPFLLLIALFIALDSPGAVFYKQKRVGKDGKDFYLIKFRSMRKNADKDGLLTVGEKDARITKVGRFIRKYKLDELPQLFNVLKGDMSLVGPRPEVRKYVDLYNEEQLKVLSVRPGLTDYASIEYVRENELLGKAQDPEKMYREEVMPAKLKLNLSYIDEKSFWVDLKIILKTIAKIVR